MVHLLPHQLLALCAFRLGPQPLHFHLHLAQTCVSLCGSELSCLQLLSAAVDKLLQLADLCRIICSLQFTMFEVGGWLSAACTPPDHSLQVPGPI